MQKRAKIITIVLSCLLLFTACGHEKSKVTGDFKKYNCYNANLGDSVETIRDTYGIKLSEIAAGAEYDATEEFYGESAAYKYYFNNGTLNAVYIYPNSSQNEEYDSLVKQYELLETEFISVFGSATKTEDKKDLNSVRTMSNRLWETKNYTIRLTGYFGVEDVNKKIEIAIIPS